MKLRVSAYLLLGAVLGGYLATILQAPFISISGQQSAEVYLKSLEILKEHPAITSVDSIAALAPTQDSLVLLQYLLAPKIVLPIEEIDAAIVSKQPTRIFEELFQPCVILVHHNSCSDFEQEYPIVHLGTSVVDSGQQEFALRIRSSVFFHSLRCL
jgi:hypothetical protein